VREREREAETSEPFAQQGICRWFFTNRSNTHSLLCVSDRGMMKGKRKRGVRREEMRRHGD